MNTIKIIKWLTYLGALPFFLAILISLGNWSLFTIQGIQWFLTYGLVILSFMAGTLWGQMVCADSNNSFSTKTIAIASNLITLIAWFTFLLSENSTAIVLVGLGFIALYLLEVLLIRDVKRPAYYLSLRLGVTAVVVFAHVIMFLII